MYLVVISLWSRTPLSTSRSSFTVSVAWSWPSTSIPRSRAWSTRTIPIPWAWSATGWAGPAWSWSTVRRPRPVTRRPWPRSPTIPYRSKFNLEFKTDFLLYICIYQVPIVSRFFLRWRNWWGSSIPNWGRRLVRGRKTGGHLRRFMLYISDGNLTVVTPPSMLRGLNLVN